MAHKRRERKKNGPFDVPDRRHDGDDSADTGGNGGVLGGPTQDSRLLGGAGRGSGLFDALERTPGDMPGLFDRPGGATGSGRRFVTKHRDGGGQSLGLFDPPRHGGKSGGQDE